MAPLRFLCDFSEWIAAPDLEELCAGGFPDLADPGC